MDSGELVVMCVPGNEAPTCAMCSAFGEDEDCQCGWSAVGRRRRGQRSNWKQVVGVIGRTQMC